MRGIWRVVVALLLVVGLPVFWTPTFDVDAANVLVAQETNSYGPAEDQRDDAKELCKNPNPRKQKKCKYNGWDNGNWRSLPRDDNDNDNDEAAAAPAVWSRASIPSGLTVDLSGSSEAPATNSPLTLTVNGAGGSVALLSWRSTGPTYDDPLGGDMAHLGELIYECAGVVPCSNSWTVTPKYNGFYAVYAKVRDTEGHEVEVVWKFTAG